VCVDAYGRGEGEGTAGAWDDPSIDSNPMNQLGIGTKTERGYKFKRMTY